MTRAQPKVSDSPSRVMRGVGEGRWGASRGRTGTPPPMKELSPFTPTGTWTATVNRQSYVGYYVGCCLRDGWRAYITTIPAPMLGVCDYEQGKILISENMLTYPQHLQYDVLMHEFAHVLAPGDEHGNEWAKWAVVLGAAPYPELDIRRAR